LVAGGCKQQDYTGKALTGLLEGRDTKKCKPKVDSYQKRSYRRAQDPFVSSREKVLLDSGDGSLKASSLQILEEGTPLHAIVDEQCLMNLSDEEFNAAPVSSLVDRSKIRLSVKKSRLQSYKIVVDSEISVNELADLADLDSCLYGVSDWVEMRTMAVPNDPMYGQQEHLELIQAADAWDKFFDPSKGIQNDVVIGIIDSGVEVRHSDLEGNMWENPGEIPNNGQDDDGNGYVDDVYGYNFAANKGDPNPQRWNGMYAGGETHGTHVAGLAAAITNNSTGISGVMGERVKIMALNVFGNQPGADPTKISAAIRYSADNGANVINLSLGGPGRSAARSAAMSSAISYAINKGVIVVVAAGNDNRDINAIFYSPASFGEQYDGMLTIGSIDAVSAIKSGFSNYSTSKVELGAPGSKSGTNGVLATVINNSYGRLQGTSMASPVAAGAAALAFGLYKDRSGADPDPAEIEDIMKTSAVKESFLTNYFLDGNRLDLVTLYDEVDSRVGSSPDPEPTPTPTPPDEEDPGEEEEEPGDEEEC
jgi:subtilisin family serine protease